MIDQDLVAYLKLLGTAAGTRVHLGNAPQDTPFPFVVIRRTGGNTPKTLGNVSLFSRAQFSINVIAKEYADAYPIANTIKDSLHGFSGTMETTSVKSSRCTAEPADGSEIDGDKVTRWLTQDFLIVHG
jgi:hypothetical protein